MRTFERDGKLVIEDEIAMPAHVAAGEPVLCPECGLIADGTYEALTGKALMDDPTDEEGRLIGERFAYDCETTIYYDGQQTVTVNRDGKDYPVLMCAGFGHAFTHADVLDIS